MVRPGRGLDHAHGATWGAWAAGDWKTAVALRAWGERGVRDPSRDFAYEVVMPGRAVGPQPQIVFLLAAFAVAALVAR